jgi:hypothetical protein
LPFFLTAQKPQVALPLDANITQQPGMKSIINDRSYEFQ